MTRNTGLGRFVSRGPAPAPANPSPGPGTAAAGAGAPAAASGRPANAAGRPEGPWSPGTAARAPRPAFPGAEVVGSRASASAGSAAPAAEICEMCATEVAAEHGHVADLEASSLICACRACYLLFTRSQAGGSRYRSVPDRYLRDPERALTVAEWDQFDIPVGLAFFLRSSQRDQVAGFYPSPAGVTECILDLGAWDRLAASHPLLTAAEPDVEAVLICRTESGVDYFLVPIDACYELAGRMRLHWRGFDGGSEARESIAEFLQTVRSRARVLSRETAGG